MHFIGQWHFHYILCTIAAVAVTGMLEHGSLTRSLVIAFIALQISAEHEHRKKRTFIQIKQNGGHANIYLHKMMLTDNFRITLGAYGAINEGVKFP